MSRRRSFTPGLARLGQSTVEQKCVRMKETLGVLSVSRVDFSIQRSPPSLSVDPATSLEER